MKKDRDTLFPNMNTQNLKLGPKKLRLFTLASLKSLHAVMNNVTFYKTLTRPAPVSSFQIFTRVTRWSRATLKLKVTFTQEGNSWAVSVCNASHDRGQLENGGRRLLGNVQNELEHSRWAVMSYISHWTSESNSSIKEGRRGQLLCSVTTRSHTCFSSCPRDGVRLYRFCCFL